MKTHPSLAHRATTHVRAWTCDRLGLGVGAHLILRAWALAALCASLAWAPSAFATNFTAAQNAALVIGAPNFTSLSYADPAKMAYGFRAPAGIAVDSGGSVFASEVGGQRIMRWAATPATDGAVMSNVAQQFSNSQASWAGQCTGGMAGPQHISVSGDGGTQKLLVADQYNHRVVGFTSEPTLDTSKADLFLGQTNGTSCNQNRDPTFPYDPPSATTLNAPIGVWTNGTRIAVVDSGNHRVLLWDSWPANGNVPADVVLGQEDFDDYLPNKDGTAIPSRDSLSNPAGVWFDGNYLYVADQGNNRVLVWSGWPNTDGEDADAVIGQSLYDVTTTSCSQLKIGAPAGVTTTGTGAGHRLAISAGNQNRIMVYSGYAGGTNPTPSGVLGQATDSSCTANRSNVSAGANTLRAPRQVSFDSGGNLWAVDHENSRVLRFPATVSTGDSANRVLGHAGGSAMLASNPYDLETLAYVNMNSNPPSATTSGGHVSIAPSTQALAHTSMLVSSTYLWTSPPTVNNEAPTWRIGQVQRRDAGNRGPGFTTGALTQCRPAGVWTDGTKLLVADSCSNRVLAWTTMPTSDTDPPDYVIGQSNFTTPTTGPPTAQNLREPWDVASDGIDVYVADQGNHRILVYRNFWVTPSNLPTATVAIGQPDSTTGTSGTTQTTLRTPRGLDIDSEGRLVVADNGNNRVMVWNAAHLINASGEPANAVIGQANFTSAATGTLTDFVQDVAADGGSVFWSHTSRAYVLDPTPTSGATLAPTAQEIGSGNAVLTVGQNRLHRPVGIDAARGRVWIANTGQGRLMRWDDTTAPTITGGGVPTATVRCDGTVTINWTTSESTSTEIGWDTVTRAWGAYTNSNVDTTMSGLTHSYELSFATPGTKYVRVRAVDWTWNGPSPNAAAISAEINFDVPTTCPAPTTMLGDDVNAQGGTARANPSATNAPPILSTAFHTSWLNGSGVTMDRRETGTWSTPPEHAGGVWHLNGSTAVDPLSQTSGGVTLVGAPSYVADGRFGQALALNGSSQSATIPHDAALSFANNFTVDTWFRTSDIDNTQYPILVQKSSGAGCQTNCTYSLQFDRATRALCGLLTTGGAQRIACSAADSSLAWTNNAWHHAALVVQAGSMRIYVNGIPVAGPVPIGGNVDQNTALAALGTTSAGGGNYFHGDIDEPRISPVAYDAAAILGYYRTKRPHLDQLWTSASTALAPNCTTTTRCEDQTYAGDAQILRPGARYWQRTRFNTLNNDYWTNWGTDWLEVTDTTSINISVGSTITFGTQLPGADAFGSSTAQVTTNAPGGYQLTARDESDTWALERTPPTDTIADRQDGATAPAVWNAGVAGYFGITVRNATGGRLPKWGTGGGPWPETDTTNNRYTGLENTTDVLLHERLTYSLATDTVTITSRVNAGPSDHAGSYDGQINLTAVANP